MDDTIRNLHFQLAEAEEKLHLILERKSQYVQETSIPLELIRDERHLESQIAEMRTRLSNLVEVTCPYRGLESFRAEDAAVYFGRQAMVERLVTKVAHSPFVVLVGSSGCGKSSLLRAGLVPALGSEMFPGSRQWIVKIISPGDDPILTLAAVFEGLLEPTLSAVDHLAESRKLAKHLREQTIILQDVIALVRSKRVDIPRMLLVVDQLEALYARNDKQDDQSLFLDQLNTVIGNDWLTILLSLRADFYQHLLKPPLGKWVDEAQLTVQAMDAVERRAVIEQPAFRTGRAFEAGLVDRILTDVSDAARDLPLLEFTLTQLWEQQTAEGQLTHAAYEDLGRVSGAVARHAESAYGHLKPDQQTIARQVLTSLVRVGRGEESGRDVRRQQAMHSFDAEAQWILSALADARLLTTSWNTLTAEPAVELVHEALIIHWKRFQDWVNADREFLLWRQRLDERTQDWEAKGRDEALLLRGKTLFEAQEWLEQSDVGLADNERAFVESSLDWQQRRQDDEQRELKARERRRKRITLAAVVVAIGFMVLAGFAVVQWRRVEQQRQIALARQLVAQAELERSNPNGSLTRAALLAVESLKRAPNVEAGMTANRILDRLAAPVSRIKHGSAVTDVEFNPDGRRMASASADGTARVWEAATGRELTRVKHRSGVTALAFSPDGQSVVSWDAGGEGRVWDAASGDEIARMKHDGRVRSHTVFSPDGSLILSGSEDGTARVWEADTGREIVRVVHESRVVDAVAFSPDGRWIASVDSGFVRVWWALSGKEVARGDTGTSGMYGIAFSPDGRYIAASGGVQEAPPGEPRLTTVVFEAATGREAARFRHEKPLYAGVAFSPDGQYLACAQGWGGSLLIWQVATSKLVTEILGGVWIWDFAFHPDSQKIATADSSGKTRIWDIPTGAEIARVEHQREILSVAFSPDGRRLASGTQDGVVQVSSFPSAWVSQVEQTQLGIPGPSYPSLAYGPDGTAVASASFSGVVVWEPTTGRVITQVVGISDTPGWAVDFGPEGRMLAILNWWDTLVLETNAWNQVAKLTRSEPTRPRLPANNKLWTVSTGGDALVWDLETREVFLWSVSSNHPQASSVSPDGRLLAQQSMPSDSKGSFLPGSSVRVLDVHSGETLVTLEHEGAVIGTAFSVDGKQIATVDNTPVARVWEVATGREVVTLTHDRSATAVAFSPNGKWIATTGNEVAMLWNTNNWHPVARFPHESGATFVAFSRDSRWVATIGKDVRIWNIATNQEVARLEHEGPVNNAVFSPDARSLLTANGTNSYHHSTAQVWMWQPEDVVASLCARITRNLDYAEWRQYLDGEPLRASCPDLPPPALPTAIPGALFSPLPTANNMDSPLPSPLPNGQQK